MRRFILDHWRGQFGLVAAFWGILVYPLIFVIGTPYVLSVFNLIQDQVISTRFWLAVLFFTLCIYLPWAFVGALRSILLHARQLKATAASVGILLCWVAALGITVHQVYRGWPVIQSMAAIAFHGEGDQLNITVNGDTLELSGIMTYGSVSKVAKAIKQNPNIQIIEFDIDAPHLHEARKLARLILKNKLDTHVRTNCSGNCLIPFTAGYYRTAASDAHFAFYEYLNYDNGYRTDWIISREREKDREFFVRRGANLKFSFELYYRYNDNAAFEPTAEQLWRGGLLAGISDQAASQ